MSLTRGLFSDMETPPAGFSRPAAKPTCAHVFKTGRRCLKDPIDEEVLLCVLHGGDMEKLQESSKRRMLALQAQALDVMEDLLVMGDDKVRASMVVAVLDRSGFGPKSVIQLDKSDDDISNMTDEQLAQYIDRQKVAADEAGRKLRESVAQCMHAITDMKSDPNVH